MSKRLVECTLLADLGEKAKRGDIVLYDAFKAAARERAGLAKIGVHVLHELAHVVEKKVSAKKASRKAKKDSE